MSYLEYNTAYIPTGIRKVLFINWPLIIVVAAICAIGITQLYSVAGGSWEPWAERHLQRFGLGMVILFAVALVPIWIWKRLSGVLYILSLVLLLLVEFVGVVGMGAQRWIDLGFMRLQPSELMKITLVLFLAAYYDWLSPAKVSQPIWVLLPVIIILIPVYLVVHQPDLGTAILLLCGGGAILFLAGVHWAYFTTLFGAAGVLVAVVLKSRGTDWQLIKDYQFRRIDSFINPESEPLGAGYHIIQSKIALGSGGWTGRGFMEGTQSRLNFLPEKHTDFIFTSYAEEFGFVGGLSLLTFYALVLIFCLISGLRMKERFSSLVTLGIAVAFFLYFALNMSMVMGLAPVVGVPLPLVSYGGSALLVLMIGFGFVQSAYIHQPRYKNG